MIKRIIYFFFFVVLGLEAQNSQIEFQRYTSSDGLSTNWNISSMVQDKDGYLWIGTSAGLNQFDGYKFKIFLNDPSDTNSISSNVIGSMLIDSKNRFWIGTRNAYHAVNLWNPEKQNFIHFETNASDTSYLFHWVITKLYEDKSGLIWVGTIEGTDLFDPEKGIYTHYSDNHPALKSMKNDYITEIKEDTKGNLWFGTLENGLVKYNPDNKHFKRFKFDPNNKNGLKSNKISAIYGDTSGTLFIGTDKNGLHIFDYSDDSIIRLSDESTNMKNLQAPISDGPLFGSEGLVNPILRCSNGDFWVGTSNGGIKLYNEDFANYNLFKNDPSDKFSISDNFIFSILEDNQNNIWLGTISRGLLKVKPSNSLFKPRGNNLGRLEILKNQRIRVIYESENGIIWVGTIDGKLIKYDTVKNVTEEYDYNPKKYDDNYGISGPDIDAIYEDKDGIIWLGTFNGVNKFDPKSRKFSRAKILYQNQIVNTSGDIEAIVKADEEHLWIASWENGIFYYDVNSLKFKHYGWNPNDSTSLSSRNIFTLFKSNAGELWVGTADGLNKFNASTKTFKHYLLGSSIHSIQEDKNDVLWIATNNGIFKFEPKTNTIKQFNQENGLPSNLVGGILIDEENYIWAGTARGLVRLDPRNETLLKYDEEDGSQLDLFETGNSYWKTSKGVLLFGSYDGITAFDPAKIKHNIHPPKILITDLDIYDIEADTTSKIRIWDHDKVNEISLGHTQSDIVFNYVGIHYTNPERNNYKYKLEPYDKEWKKAGTLRAARYTNLDPGEYAFKVIAANSDGVWSTKEAELKIIINPPWWKTWWAYLSYILLGFGLLYFIRSFELKRQRKNATIKESKLRAESAEFQAKAIEAQSKVIQAENDRKSAELEEARQLQLSMLPKELPKVDNLDIAVYMKTATEVGGDYYDFSIKEDGSLNIVLGDATGHGMKAGTLVSMIKSLFVANSIDKSMQDFFTSTNNALKESKLDKMMMAFAMVNIKNSKIEISNAGIPPIYIYRKEEKKIEEINLNGLPLGAMKNSKHEIYQGELFSGDTILMLSDGMPELMNNKKEMYGYERVVTSFESVADKQSSEIVSYLKEEGSKWVNDKDPDDDVTFVVIKVK